MGRDDAEQVLVTSRTELRQWFEANAGTSPSIWLVTYKRGSGKPAPTYDEVVEEALCFGWIDSTLRARDAQTSMLRLSRRRPRSTWAASNRARVERLTAAGLMTQSGLHAVETARANGSWDMLKPVERLETPDDLAAALDSDPAAREYFDGLPPGTRRQLLWHIVSARRPETRARRIAKVVADAGDRS